ncbi:DUF2474 family protein [Hyphococcus luteus]|uniref:DUF2474 domain-containing protein n=1 Tax=Hyphococcus luteus TaxID=2058213 RepID=A0A2S7KAM0_9PROT|nr:DUF2474 family protein [Marinicaulis flavus]PQA89531.1 DUF2474 domain-containing protein [Marinicaulis flavus]
MRAGDDSPLWKKLGWFVLLWIAGVSAVMLIASILKLAMAGVAS